MKIFLALIFITGAILASGLWYGEGTEQKTSVAGYLDMMSLSHEQMQKVDKIRDDFLPKVEMIRRELRSKRLALTELIFKPRPDMQAIEKTSREISNLQNRLENEVINHILEEMKILTPDQQVQFHEIIKNEFEKGGLGVHGETMKK